MPEFMTACAGAGARPRCRPAEELFGWTEGAPLCMRFLMGLLLDYAWAELARSCRASAPRRAATWACKKPLCVCSGKLRRAEPDGGRVAQPDDPCRGRRPLRCPAHLFWGDLGSDAEQCRPRSTGLTSAGAGTGRVSIAGRHPPGRAALPGGQRRAAGRGMGRRHAAFYLGQAATTRCCRWNAGRKWIWIWGNIFRAPTGAPSGWSASGGQRRWRC